MSLSPCPLPLACDLCPHHLSVPAGRGRSRGRPWVSRPSGQRGCDGSTGEWGPVGARGWARRGSWWVPLTLFLGPQPRNCRGAGGSVPEGQKGRTVPSPSGSPISAGGTSGTWGSMEMRPLLLNRQGLKGDKGSRGEKVRERPGGGAKAQGWGGGGRVPQGPGRGPLRDTGFPPTHLSLPGRPRQGWSRAAWPPRTPGTPGASHLCVGTRRKAREQGREPPPLETPGAPRFPVNPAILGVLGSPGGLGAALSQVRFLPLERAGAKPGAFGAGGGQAGLMRVPSLLPSLALLCSGCRC